MNEIFHIIHVMVAVGLIGLILIQHGKGADAGAAFGSGASSTVFGSQGSGSFLTRTTSVLATAFFISCMILAYFSSQKIDTKSIVSAPTDNVTQQVTIDPNSDLPPVLENGADMPLAPAPATDATTKPITIPE